MKTVVHLEDLIQGTPSANHIVILTASPTAHQRGNSSCYKLGNTLRLYGVGVPACDILGKREKDRIQGQCRSLQISPMSHWEVAFITTADTASKYENH